MPKIIKIDILRPVNPSGLSFIRYCWGAMGARDQRVITTYKKEYSKLLRELGGKITEKVGEDKLITGVIEVELSDDSEPISAKVTSLEIWERKGKIEEVIEVSLK